MPDLPSEPLELDFRPDAYRDVVALTSAYAFGDFGSFEALLSDADRDVICAFVVVMWAAIGMVSAHGGCSFAEELEALGRTAARFAAGELS